MPTTYSVRKQIRDAAATALTGLTTTDSRVFKDRPYKLQANELPALCLSTPEDSSVRQSMSGAGIREATLVLQVEYAVKGLIGYDDTVDLMDKEVIKALDANPTLGGLCQWIEPGEFTLDVAGEAEQPVALGRRRFTILYLTAVGAPDIAL